jgi:hypothetical protein
LTSGNGCKSWSLWVAEIKYKIGVVERLGIYLGPGEDPPIARCARLRGERRCPVKTMSTSSSRAYSDIA